jgi:hypothetical protein
MADRMDTEEFAARVAKPLKGDIAAAPSPAILAAVAAAERKRARIKAFVIVAVVAVVLAVVATIAL